MAEPYAHSHVETSPNRLDSKGRWLCCIVSVVMSSGWSVGRRRRSQVSGRSFQLSGFRGDKLEQKFGVKAKQESTSGLEKDGGDH